MNKASTSTEMATVSIDFLVQNTGGGLSRLTLDADALRRVMRMNAEEARKLGSQLINLATKSQAFEGISSAISAVRQPMASLTSESEGFTRAMRAANTMAEGSRDRLLRYVE